MEPLRWKVRLMVLILFWLPSFAVAADYVGSDKCGTCHRDVYDRWKVSLHNKSQQELSPANDRVVVEWRGVLKLQGGNIPEYTVKLSKQNGEYYATLVDSQDPAKEATYKVVRTYGGWGWKQRYQVKIGNMHFILPIQWNQASSRWVAYNPHWWYTESGALKTPPPRNSFELDCAGCHNTGLVMAKDDKGIDVRYSELNSGCEKCHGPGSAHMGSPNAGTIINPKKLAYDRHIESCGMCHSRGVSKPAGSFGYPWNDRDNKPYLVGEPLDNYYQFRPGEWGGMQAHAKNHHQQWHDLLRSKHYTAKVTCAGCHDPHGSANPYQLAKKNDNNDLCLTCHKRFATPEAVRNHAKHSYAPETTGTGRCSKCHMVKTASSAEAGDIHSHDFKIIKPSLNLEDFKKDPKTAAPNSCNGCHKDWGNSQAGYEAGVKAYDKLFGK